MKYFNKACARLFFYGLAVVIVLYICGGPAVVNQWAWWQVAIPGTIALVVSQGTVEWWDGEDDSS